MSATDAPVFINAGMAVRSGCLGEGVQAIAPVLGMASNTGGEGFGIALSHSSGAPVSKASTPGKSKVVTLRDMEEDDQIVPDLNPKRKLCIR